MGQRLREPFPFLLFLTLLLRCNPCLDGVPASAGQHGGSGSRCPEGSPSVPPSTSEATWGSSGQMAVSSPGAFGGVPRPHRSSSSRGVLSPGLPSLGSVRAVPLPASLLLTVMGASVWPWLPSLRTRPVVAAGVTYPRCRLSFPAVTWVPARGYWPAGRLASSPSCLLSFPLPRARC